MSSGEPKTRRRGGLALVLGIVALGAAFVVAFRGAGRATPPVSLTAERSGTTRAAVAASLVRAGAARGLDAHLVETASMSEALDEVNAGRIDLALVSGVSRLGEHPQVREVAPLYVEALHLLVKQEIADAVAESLGALRGRRVAISASGSVTAGLAMAVLAFAGLDANEGAARQGVVVDESDLRDLMDRVARGDRQSMPDAIFRLETIPSKVVLTLVREAEYRLVALPFADALRLSALRSPPICQRALNRSPSLIRTSSASNALSKQTLLLLLISCAVTGGANGKAGSGSAVPRPRIFALAGSSA
jgi:hypothetical protein